jgi:anti-anti-sigma regulatory factor
MEIPSEIRVDRGSAGVTVVELVGEHDLAGADELAAALACEGDLIVDLSESTFVDSTVIHLLCRTQRILTERGSELVVQVPAAGLVLRTLEITGVTTNVTVVHDREQALCHLHSPAQVA